MLFNSMLYFRVFAHIESRSSLRRLPECSSPIPTLELIPFLNYSHPRPFFSCTYVEPILQALSFHIHPWNRGCTYRCTYLPRGLRTFGRCSDHLPPVPLLYILTSLPLSFSHEREL